jgi:hypothetical protein
VRQRARNARILPFAIATVCLLVVIGPALAHTVQARLLSIVEHGISGSVSFKTTNNGRTVGKTTIGVVGQGTISGKLSLDARLAATLLGAVKGVPLTGLASGGSYVVSYDIDAKGDHKGIVVVSFKSPGVGSLCLNFTVTYGKFVPGKTDYVPSTATFNTVGGVGTIAKVHASGRVTQGEVTGNTIEQILAHGSLVSITTGPATPFSTQCARVSKLAKP